MTLEGFRLWATSDDFPEHLRAAYLDNEIFLDMSNEELETHNKAKTEIARVLAGLVKESELGEFYSDGVLISHEEAEVSNNPDASFFTWESFREGRVRLVPRENEEGQYMEIEGTPDWVLEVVSFSSVQKDTVQLRRAYHRAGIPEYWLVDARGADIDFQILQRRKTGYAATPVKEGWPRSRIFGRSFRLTRKRDPLDFWQYALEVKGA
jgi:Uma2 family endonuclease